MKTFKNIFLLIMVFAISQITVSAQGKNEQSAGAYMDKFSQPISKISADIFAYVSAIAHDKSARKVDKRRKDLMIALHQAKSSFGRIAPFGDNDTSLKSASYQFISLMLDVMNNDYSKIVNMEEISEQSYDNMEAYMMAQQKADEKLHEASENMENSERDFAKRHNINLIEDESKIAKKLEAIGKVNDYYNKLYLVFFKSYKQELYLIKAMGEKDVTAIEQSRTTLLANSDEGMKKLNSETAFEGDNSVITTGQKLLKFYSDEATNKVPACLAFLSKGENVAKLKKAMDAKSQKTQEDVDTYNAAINDYNATVNRYNKTLQETNQQRGKVIDDWNNTVKKFLDKHSPK